MTALDTASAGMVGVSAVRLTLETDASIAICVVQTVSVLAGDMGDAPRRGTAVSVSKALKDSIVFSSRQPPPTAVLKVDAVTPRS